MRVRRGHLTVTLAAAIAVGMTTVAGAHPDGGSGENQISYEEHFPGEGVEQEKQHDGDEGHLPPVERNVDLIGKAEVTNPSGSGNTGRVADVAAYGDYAYLNAFRDPTCEAGGVHVVDIADVIQPGRGRLHPDQRRLVRR